jgi:putative flippase GtrA
MDQASLRETGAPARRRRRLLPKFTAVALIGFAVSALILHLGMDVGLRPWLARVIALVVAMNVTFVINGRFVFRALSRGRVLAQWGAYVTNSAFGNICNCLVFVALQSSHRPVIGNPYVALLAGSATAWAINFLGARFLVFGAAGRRLAGRCAQLFANRPSRPPGPASAEPGSSRR